MDIFPIVAILLGIVLFFIIAQIIRREPVYVDTYEPKLKKSANYIAKECVKGLRAGVDIEALYSRFPEMAAGRLLYVYSSAIIPLVLVGELSIKQLGKRAHDIACAAKFVIERAFEDTISDLDRARMGRLIELADSLDISLCSPNLLVQMRASAEAHKKDVDFITAPLKYYPEEARAKIQAELTKLLA